MPFWLLAAAPAVYPAIRVLGRHPIAWIAGAAAGYAFTCLALWAVIAARAASVPAFLGAWALEFIALTIVGRVVRRPTVVLPEWRPGDTAALCAVLLLVPALMARPYGNLGVMDQSGHRYYRAYFTADFVWHTALASEVGRFEMPPRNPYMADRRLNYYWTYFLVPATVASAGPRELRDVQSALKVNAVCTAALLVGATFAFAFTAGGRPLATAVAVTLVILASSAEGLSAIQDLRARGRSLDGLRDLNIDAVTAWRYRGLRIDGVHRTMYYNPQHGLSGALGVLALVAAASTGAAAPLGAIVVSGLLLGLATTMNPFLGAVFSAIYGASVLVDAVIRRVSLLAVSRHAVAAVPPVLAVLWGTANAMAEGAGEALTIGWTGYARNAPVATLLLSLGPVLIPGLLGFFPDRRLPAQPARMAGIMIVLGLFLFYFVVLTDRFWVGFRAGQILLAALPLPLARAFDRLFALPRGSLVVTLVAAAILTVGAPTTLVDAFNAGDIANRRMGPGFPWTVVISPDEHEALSWIKRATPATAVVQAEPIVRGRTQWSFIPSFAERRMNAGLPISLLPLPEYAERSRRVQSMFTLATAAQAHAIATRLNIDYLWIGPEDRQAYPAGVERISRAPELFEPAFQNDMATVYMVRK